MKIKCSGIAAALLLLACCARPTLAVAQQEPGTPPAAATARVDGIELRLGRALMRVTALADDIIRGPVLFGAPATGQTMRFCRITSRYQAALSLGVRRWVAKST